METADAAGQYQPVDWRAAEGRHPPKGSEEYDLWQQMHPLEHASPAPNPFGIAAAASMEFEDTGLGRPSPAETQVNTRPLPIAPPI